MRSNEGLRGNIEIITPEQIVQDPSRYYFLRRPFISVETTGHIISQTTSNLPNKLTHVDLSLLANMPEEYRQKPIIPQVLDEYRLVSDLAKPGGLVVRRIRNPEVEHEPPEYSQNRVVFVRGRLARRFKEGKYHLKIRENPQLLPEEFGK